MKKVYEKLLQQLSQMSPEQKAEEWEDLKYFNEIGPEGLNTVQEENIHQPFE